MSGIEILGIAASVLQIADLGGRLSVKLFTFSRKIKNAHKSIDSISQDIAATGAILQQLGSELKKDAQLRLCSQEAVSAAKDLVAECNKIFVELNSALDGGKSQTQGSRLVLGWKDRLKFSFLEPQIDLLRSNLERLKSSLAVMLNVMIFAEQLRNQEALPILKEQRELIKILVEDKAVTQKRFEQALKTIDHTPANAEPPKIALGNPSSREISNQTTQGSFVAIAGLQQDQKPVNVEPVLVPPLPVGLLRWKEEIEDHSALVKRLLEEASASHHNVDHGQRHRIHEGILYVHWEEWSRLRRMYNRETLMRAFSSRHPVSRFWQSQLERDVPSLRSDDRDSLAEQLPRYPGPPIVKDTDDSLAEVTRSPSPPSPSQAYKNIEHPHVTTEVFQQGRIVPLPLSARNTTSRPQTHLEIPTPSHPKSDDSEDDSDDGLFSIPLSARRPTTSTEHKYSGRNTSTKFDLTRGNVQHEYSTSPSVKQVPPATLAELEQQPVQPRYISSRTSKVSFKNPDTDHSYAHDLCTNEHLPNAQEKDDVTALALETRFIEREHYYPRGGAEVAAVPLSPPGAQVASHRVAGEGPAVSLEDSSEINLTVSKPAGKADGSKAKVTPVSFSRVGSVERASSSESAVSSFESKPRTTLLDRGKYQFEADSEDDELEDEIDANLEELSWTARRLGLLAGATGSEVEAQNQHLQRISVKSDRLDAGSTVERDVVDELLSRWTKLPKTYFEEPRTANLRSNIEKLRRIS